MITFIEPLYKTGDYIDFGWNPEPGATAYRMYVGLASGSMSLVYDNIGPDRSERAADRGKVPYRAEIADVLTAAGLTTGSFLDTVFWFAITYKNSVGAWSVLSDSTPVEVPPVGITPRFMRDDPTINRHNFVFSHDLQKWVKGAGTSSGALVVDTADFYKSNLTTEYTYDGTNVATVKSYSSDTSVAGSPAKLTTYMYTGSQVTKISITDSTV